MLVYSIPVLGSLGKTGVGCLGAANVLAPSNVKFLVADEFRARFGGQSSQQTILVSIALSAASIRGIPAMHMKLRRVY